MREEHKWENIVFRLGKTQVNCNISRRRAVVNLNQGIQDEEQEKASSITGTSASEQDEVCMTREISISREKKTNIIEVQLRMKEGEEVLQTSEEYQHNKNEDIRYTTKSKNATRSRQGTINTRTQTQDQEEHNKLDEDHGQRRSKRR